MRDGYIGGLCDPTKATKCTKDHCAAGTNDTNGCRYTTVKEWIRDDYYDRRKEAEKD